METRFSIFDPILFLSSYTNRWLEGKVEKIKILQTFEKNGSTKTTVSYLVRRTNGYEKRWFNEVALQAVTKTNNFSTNNQNQ